MGLTIFEKGGLSIFNPVWGGTQIFSGIVNIGVVDATDTTMLQVRSGSAGAVTPVAGTLIAIESNAGDKYLSFLVPDNTTSGILFGITADNDSGAILYNHFNQRMQYKVMGTDRLYHSANSFAFQEATTISNTTGDMSYAGAVDGALYIRSKRTNDDNAFYLMTPGVTPTFADTLRLSISGRAATTGTVAWTNINAMSFDQAINISNSAGGITITAATDFNIAATVTLANTKYFYIATFTNGHYIGWDAYDVDGTALVEVARIQNANDPFFKAGCLTAFQSGYLESTGDLYTSAVLRFTNTTDTASAADRVDICGYEISAGHRALAIGCEEAVVAEVDETKFSHKLPVRINGATYNIMLCAT